MNYLRSAAVLAVSGTTLFLAAGCSADVQDESTPLTGIESGIDPNAPTGTSYCPPASAPEKPVFYQVQASRVAKYAFGGNDPWDDSIDPATGAPANWSKEFGDDGTAKPDLSNPKCVAARDCWHKVHDALYPPSSCQPTYLRDEKGNLILDKAGNPIPVTSKDGTTTQCRSAPAPIATLSSAGLSNACGLKAELFQINGPSTVPFDSMACVEYLDSCWGQGVSGFVRVSTPPASGDKNRDAPPIVDFDPQPASLTAPLGSTTGATAAAILTNSGVYTTVLQWPGTWKSGGTAVAGTPCSNIALGAGSTTTKAIQVIGSQSRCL